MYINIYEYYQLSSLLKKGYGLVSARSQPYCTRPEAKCDMAGLMHTPGRISSIQRG